MKDDSAHRAVNWFELDRLVDGQLAPQEYRELLRQVEKDPDGWRQCAMAFLQHQAMEREFKAFANSPESPLDRPAGPVATPPIYVRQLSRSMKVICGVSIALILGITAGVSMRPVGDVRNTQIGISNDGNSMIVPAYTDKRSSAAPAPSTSSFSRSSNGLQIYCDEIVEPDPYLGRCKRSQNQMDHKE